MVEPVCATCPSSCPLPTVAVPGNDSRKRYTIPCSYDALPDDQIPGPLNVIIAHANDIRKCEDCKTRLSTTYRIPDIWWEDWCKRSNGFFGCEETYTADDQLDGYNTWFHFLVKQVLDSPGPDGKDYIWYKFNIFTRWSRSTKRTTVIIFDPKEDVQAALLQALTNKATFPHPGIVDPYWIHSLIIEQVVTFQHKAVWKVRGIVRDIEKSRPSDEAPEPDYHRFHDVARHAIHVSETLELAMQTLAEILSEHDQVSSSSLYSTQSTSGNSRPVNNLHSETARRLRFFRHGIHSLRFRASSNKERLTNEIQLAFNLVAQHDARSQVDIATAARADSDSMRKISFASLLFLPTTLVSAIFSTTFFNFGADSSSWTVSESFWIFWVVSGVITLLTGIGWHFGMGWMDGVRMVTWKLLHVSGNRDGKMINGGVTERTRRGNRPSLGALGDGDVEKTTRVRTVVFSQV